MKKIPSHILKAGIRITLLLAIAVYFALLVVGVWGIQKCPVQEYIPLFLIATGGVGLFSKFITFMRDHIALHIDVKYIETTFYSVETVFFILGSYWVYKEYQPKYDPSYGNHYCNKTVYMFAFVYLTALYAIAVAIVSGFACFLVCILFLKTVESGEENVDAEAQTNTEEAENRPAQEVA
ncbi:hypothetical protein NQ317_010286 [Molorchus minor]|uniref:MARVEL domain-containing protein n=1 Tax=Molorchus minor TaxID=1323400 RepID=A0ABQ9IZM0_9CUCU|nr:hypothetical protein NQ317_010286 [Molorchus minor]